MGIIDFICKNAKENPDKIAIVFSDESLSYVELIEQIRITSGALDGIGIVSGSHIGLLLNNSIEFIIVMLAAADIGATVIPLNSTLGYDNLCVAIESCDIEYIVGLASVLRDTAKSKDIPVKACISVRGHNKSQLEMEELVKLVDDKYELLQKNIDIETDFILTMTSGSTSAFSALKLYNLSSNDITLVATPLYHSISQRLVLLPLITGGTCVVMQQFTGKKWVEFIEKYKISFTIAVSAQLEGLINNFTNNIKQSIASLKCIVSCCSLLDEKAKRKLIENIECEFHECYGASEVGTISDAAFSDRHGNLSTIGRAIPGVEIKIVDDENNALGYGKVGEICCKSTMQFSRYYKNIEATRNSIVKGFFHTGDMGFKDESGYIFFSGRKKEIIIVGGTNVYPKDIESVLNAHSQVEECAVVGIKDSHFGEIIQAIIIPKDKAIKVKDMQFYCLDRLADYQQPMLYKFVDNFPRSGLGKVLKNKLIDNS